jgi:D-arabinose 1-dehydrogenase-like Zn-dependent alcohol dehydrogenase
MGGIGDEICWRVRRLPDGTVTAGLDPLGWDATASPAAGDAVVRVEAAGFNYKDALCCAGHPGVMRTSPLVPGIDAAGVLVAGGGLPAGTAVVVTGNGLGEVRDGAFAGFVRPPAHAVIPRPATLSAESAMALGTAGLTALVACDRLAGLVAERHAVPDEAWLVTGASGGACSPWRRSPPRAAASSPVRGSRPPPRRSGRWGPRRRWLPTRSAIPRRSRS